jgi:uncharacterized membrane protein YbaN (DUF454 family)
MFFVGLGILGTILPLMPGFVFFIFALWAFRNGSPALEQRLLSNRVIGPKLQDWDENRQIPLKIKWIAILCILGAGGSSLARMHGKVITIPQEDPRWEFLSTWVQIPLALLMIYGIWFIARAKTK